MARCRNPEKGNPVSITRTYVRQNPDGSAHFHYQVEGDRHAVLTGKVYGTLTTSDGTSYDVSEPVIEVASAAHAGEIAHLAGIHHEEHGHPDHDPGDPFTHLCTDSCGPLKRETTTGPQTGHPVGASS